jgi:hypothetical protein
LRLDLDLVDAVGQALGIEVALIVGSEGVAILVALADEFDRGFEREAVGVGDFEAEFSGVALREERKSKEEDSEVEQGAHSVGWRKPYAISFRMGDWKLRREWVDPF